MSKDPRHPDFIIIGAQKAGTTTLFQQICGHPEVFPSKIKETHFFTSAEFYSADISEYFKKFFNGAEHYKCKGEATPAYLRNGSKVIPRIENQLNISEIKFLVVLRNPVDRAWSHYLHRRRSLNESLEFVDAVEAEESRLLAGEENAGYFKQGLYGEQLVPWVEKIGLENLLIIRFEDLVQNTQKELQRVFEYLALNSSVDQASMGVKKNQGGVPKFPVVMKYLKNPDAPGKKLLKSVLAPQIRRELKTRLRQLNVKPFPVDEKPIMDSETQKKLWDSYRADMELLHQITGFDSSVWEKSCLGVGTVKDISNGT